MQSMPGVNRNLQQATPRKVLLSERGLQYIPSGKVIDGAESRDPDNTNDKDVLRAGMVVGALSGGKYAPSIIGVLRSSYTSGSNTTVPATTQAAEEVQRRVGISNDIKVVGPPSAGGTVDVVTATVSSIDTSTGDITVNSDLGVDFISGAFIMPADGAEFPLALIADNRDVYGIKVTDENDNNIDVQFAQPVVGGLIDASQIINYPSDSALKKWLKRALNGEFDDAGTITHRGTKGSFVFDDDY
jgi:hypothetical protein